jgi:hypothetical protein
MRPAGLRPRAVRERHELRNQGRAGPDPALPRHAGRPAGRCGRPSRPGGVAANPKPPLAGDQRAVSGGRVEHKRRVVRGRFAAADSSVAEGGRLGRREVPLEPLELPVAGRPMHGNPGVECLLSEPAAPSGERFSPPPAAAGSPWWFPRCLFLRRVSPRPRATGLSSCVSRVCLSCASRAPPGAAEAPAATSSARAAVLTGDPPGIGLGAAERPRPGGCGQARPGLDELDAEQLQGGGQLRVGRVERLAVRLTEAASPLGGSKIAQFATSSPTRERYAMPSTGARCRFEWSGRRRLEYSMPGRARGRRTLLHDSSAAACRSSEEPPPSTPRASPACSRSHRSGSNAA